MGYRQLQQHGCPKGHEYRKKEFFSRDSQALKAQPGSLPPQSPEALQTPHQAAHRKGDAQNHSSACDKEPQKERRIRHYCAQQQGLGKEPQAAQQERYRPHGQGGGDQRRAEQSQHRGPKVTGASEENGL